MWCTCVAEPAHSGHHTTVPDEPVWWSRTQTYTIAPGSRAAKAQLAVNDTATVRGTLANGAATATSVDEGQ